MAPLVRRTWAEIATEVTTFVGGYDYTGFSTRVQYAIDATYRELCTGYHHFEMEAATNVTVATNDTTVTLPTSPATFITMGLYRPSTATLGNMLDQKSFAALSGQFSATAAIPVTYCRFGAVLLLNCPCVAGSAGTWVVRHYTFPTAPDFSSGSPATSWLFDDVIIQGAVAKMMNRVWRPDLAMFGLQTMQSWLASQPQPALIEQTLGERADLPTASRPLGGSQS
jgi:hypothetical protein